MAVYTWDAIYDRLKVDQGGLPNKSTQDMLDTFWTLAGYPDGTLGADAKVAFYESQGAIGDSLGDLEYDYWYRIGPNILAAKGAVFAIDAARSINGEQWALNAGSGGQVLRAKYGSVARAEIRNGVGLVLPGTSGNYAQVPDSAALDLTGDMEIVVRVSVDQLAPSVQQILVQKYATSNNSYGLEYGPTAGTPRFRTTADGSTTFTTRTSPTGFSATDLWLKVTYQANNGGNYYCKYYTAPDSVNEPSSWNYLDQVVGPPVSIFSGSAPVQIGGGNNVAALSLAGVMKRTIIRNGIGGTTVLDIDFTTQPDLTTSFTCTTGQTITVTAANAVDTNDPLWLPWSGENYAYFPGGGNNEATSPDSSVWITTNQDIRVRAAISDWTTSGYQTLVNQGWSEASYGFWFGVDSSSTGKLAFFFSPNGTTVGGIGSSVAPPLIDGQRYDLRVTRVQSTGTTRFFYKDTSTPITSNSGWTEIGTSATVHAGSSMANSTGTLRIGGSGAAHAATGSIFRVLILGDIDGSPVVDVDFTQNTNHSSFTCTTGQTVTFSRATSGRKTAVVTRPIWLLGTDDYMEVADNDLLDFNSTDDFTVIAVARLFGSPSYNALLAKKGGGGAVAGWWLVADSGSGGRRYIEVGDGVTSVAPITTGITSGGLDVVWGRRSAGTLGSGVAATASTTAAAALDTRSTSVLRVGLASGGSNPLDGEVLAVGVFRRALSSTELAQIVAWYNAS